MNRDWALHRTGIAVLVGGLVVTAALSVGAQLSYLHNQQRLTALQTSLTGSALGAAPVDFERRLGQVVQAAANSSDPVGAFRRLIASSMKPNGQFTNTALIELHNGKSTLLAHLGLAPIRNPTDKAATALFESGARSGSLITTRVIGHGIQKLGYLMAASGINGTFAVYGAQSIPIGRIITVPQTSPDAGLNVAIYFGRTTDSSSLIESTARHPLSGAVSKSVVPFGTSVLTLVATAKTSLAGTLSEFLPWAIAVAGVALTLVIALLAERLTRRQRRAEDLAAENERLYSDQRSIAHALQQALLPARVPEIPGMEIAVRYLPGMIGTEVGGDWYDVIDLEEGQFVFVVGDVSGRGVAAAAVMASLRHSARGFAMEGHPPEKILEHLYRMLNVSVDGHIATVLCGLVDVKGHEVTLANAGHLPPVLCHDAQGEVVETKVGPPIGVSLRQSVGSTQLHVNDCSTLVVYTDGLIERRGQMLEAGITRLTELAAADCASVEQLLDDVLAEFTQDAAPDDIALIGMKWQS